MFSRFRTSTRISLTFTIFTLISVIVFGLLVNIIFFQLWYRASMTKLYHQHNMQIPNTKKNILPKRNPVQQFTLQSPQARIIKDNIMFRNISAIDDVYVLFLPRPVANGQGILSVLNITDFITQQKNLLFFTLILVGIFGIGAYILSKWFVRRSLHGLWQLVAYSQHNHTDHLHPKLTLPGPKNDELKMLSETLYASFQKMYHHTRSLKDFIGHASHEIKTPLMAMSTEIDYLERTGKYKDIGNLKTYIETMKRLIEQLLLITRIEQTQMIEKSFVSVGRVLAQSIAMIQKKYPDRDLVWKVESGDDIQILCHAPSWEMIIQNLLDNAVKYTPKGTIRVSLTQHHLIIEDTGQGIASSHLSHIRERFRQADSAGTDTTSFGLGLYLVKKLVDLHDWKIEASSQVGEGTSFSLFFSPNKEGI